MRRMIGRYGTRISARRCCRANAVSIELMNGTDTKNINDYLSR